ncbi:MAG: MarR family winged helix-turn-helix transcriptional regulator [Beijerinckiaceae bacterium]
MKYNATKEERAGRKAPAQGKSAAARGAARKLRTETGKIAATKSPLAEASPGEVDMGRLPGFIGYPLRRAQLAIFEDFNRTVGKLGLKPGQFSVLTVIKANPGLRQTAAAEALGIKGPNFVAVVNELERRGLAERRALDRRSYGLYLTGAGEKLADKAAAALARRERKFDEALGKGGRAELMRLLHKLAQF